MINGIYTSGLGAYGMSERINVIANNLANINTVAFRSDQLSFSERLTEALEDRPDLKHYNQLVHRYGGAPFIDDVQYERQPGGYEMTERPLDVAIRGEGWFLVRETSTDREFYTRAGNFIFNNEGTLVTADGHYEVMGASRQAIRRQGEEASSEFVIDPHGTIYQGGEAIDTLNVETFSDPSKLVKYGNNLFSLAEGELADPATGYRVEQGSLEISSTNPVGEMVDMIKSMRLLETNLQMVSIQDQTLDKLVNDFARMQG